MDTNPIYEAITTAAHDGGQVITYKAYNLQSCVQFLEEDIFKEDVITENGIEITKHPDEYVWIGKKGELEVFKVEIRKVQILKID